MAQQEINQKRLFLGCFVALVATAFAFVVRASVLSQLADKFDLTQEDKGMLNGVGLYPFAISIILLSLIIDKIGYGRAMAFAFVGHIVSAVIIIFATNFQMLYIGTFIFSLANGAVEAVINPVVATMYDKQKTHWLNILHAGWPGGLVLGGLLAIGIGAGAGYLPEALEVWQWQMTVIIIPPIIYGVLLFGQNFPVQERVSAGVSDKEMLQEFGWGSAYVCFFLLIAGINQILVVFNVPVMEISYQALAAIVPTIAFGIYIKSFGRPMFVFLLLIMVLLATTELGTDAWISDIMKSVLGSGTKGILFLVYTSAIMFILRFFAGPIVHRISPLGLLAASAAIATVGLYCLSAAGDAVFWLFAAATLYGVGKTFFWPTTLGVVSEQYPKGGTLMLNAISGVGMLAVGVLGSPFIGTVQDQDFSAQIQKVAPDLATKVIVKKNGILGEYEALNPSPELSKSLTEKENDTVKEVRVNAQQGTLAKIAILPAAMFVCYIILIIYFRSQGGYQAEVLTGHAANDEKFTGGVEGPVE